MQPSNGACGIMSKISTRIATKKKQEPPLPLPFELPRNYKPEVMVGLENGFLSATAKSKFLGDVAAAVFRYKSYPTASEYDHLGQQILAKCPFLKSTTSTGYVS